MTDKRKDREKLMNLQHLANCNINFFEEMGGLVYRIYDTYILFDVTGYGSNINYDSAWDKSEIDGLLDEVYSWK